MTAQLLRPFNDRPQTLLLQAPVPCKQAAESLTMHLLRNRVVSAADLVTSLALNSKRRGKLADILLARGMVGEEALYTAMAEHWGLRLVDPTQTLPDPRLIDRYGAARCLADGVLPFGDAGGATVILAADPETFARHHTALNVTFGPVLMALASPRQMEAALLQLRGAALANLAENRVPDAESCRNWRLGAAHFCWTRAPLLERSIGC